MLKKLLSPFTSPNSVGVNVRYLTLIITTVLTLLGALNLLSEDQVEALKASVPELLAAISALIGTAVYIYGVITKSASEKADAAAKAIDSHVPADAPVRIETPKGQSDIIISAEGKKVSS